MTLKETIKIRYGNGQINTALVHIGELLIVAGIVGGLVMWASVGKIETKFDLWSGFATHRMDRLYESQKEIKGEIIGMRNCIDQHLQNADIHQKHK